jgi:hypothetical protein
MMENLSAKNHLNKDYTGTTNYKVPAHWKKKKKKKLPAGWGHQKIYRMTTIRSKETISIYIGHVGIYGFTQFKREVSYGLQSTTCKLLPKKASLKRKNQK